MGASMAASVPKLEVAMAAAAKTTVCIAICRPVGSAVGSAGQ
jgi:hypothetical protein